MDTQSSPESQLSSAQQMTIEIAIFSLDYLKSVAKFIGKPIGHLTREDIEGFARVNPDMTKLRQQNRRRYDPRIDPNEHRPACPQCGGVPKKAGGSITGRRRWICRNDECRHSWHDDMVLNHAQTNQP